VGLKATRTPRPGARRAVLRREEILDASERVFAEKGYHEAGIADVAAELGIGHGTFYRYFKNKHDIALAVFDRVMARFAEIAMADDPTLANTLDEYRAQVARLIERWLALGDSHPHILRFFHEQSVVVDLGQKTRMIDAYATQTARFLANGVEKGFLRADLDVRTTAELLVALIFEGTRRTLAMTSAADRRRWADAGLALMFDGVRAIARPGSRSKTRPGWAARPGSGAPRGRRGRPG
jgi:AcrR family transcriptional regulator